MRLTQRPARGAQQLGALAVLTRPPSTRWQALPSLGVYTDAKGHMVSADQHTERRAEEQPRAHHRPVPAASPRLHSDACVA